MVTDRRIEARRIVTVPISCECSSSGLENGAALKGITINISGGGVCFYTHENLAAGLDIKLASAEIWDCAREGKVQWCRRIMSGLYKIGLALA